MQFLHSGFLRSEGGGGGAVFNVCAHAEADAQVFAGAKVVTPWLPPFETDTVEMAKWVRDVEGNDDGDDEREGDGRGWTPQFRNLRNLGIPLTHLALPVGVAF